MNLPKNSEQNKLISYKKLIRNLRTKPLQNKESKRK